MSLSCMVKDGLGPPISCVLTFLLVSVPEQPTEAKAAMRRIDRLMAVDLIFILRVFGLFGFMVIANLGENGARGCTGYPQQHPDLLEG